MNPFDENSNPLPPQEPRQAAQESIEDLAADDTAESEERGGRTCFAAIRTAAVPMMIAILKSLDMSVPLC